MHSTTVFQSQQPRQPFFHRLLTWLGACRFLTVSLFVHAFIVLGFGSAVLYHIAPEPPDFVSGSEGSLVETTNAPVPPTAPELSKALPTEFTPPAPTMAPLPVSVLVTTAKQAPTFVVAAVPSATLSDSMKSAMAAIDANRLGEAGGASGLGAGRLGGMAKVSFFGVKTQAKRIAFLLDYSGSMEGQFRHEMEEELERSLKALPPGTQILIIPWAGGAWLYNQEATEIAGQWQEIGGKYDNFAVRAGEKLAQPEWVPISPGNVEKLMKGVRDQKSWPGGTDWRSPFRYAMEANPPPDTIFFMTDGQIEDVDRGLAGIDGALKKAPRQPAIFALWIRNKQYKADTMKLLAEKYHGEFREVGAMPKGK